MTVFTATEARHLIISGDAPIGMHVHGSLYLHWTDIITLPEGLRVGDDLHLRGTTIAALPAGLSVGGNLYLDGTAITTLPEGLSVGGGIYLGPGSKLNFPTAWFAIAGRAGRWRVVGRDGEYALLRSDTESSPRTARSTSGIGEATETSV